MSICVPMKMPGPKPQVISPKPPGQLTGAASFPSTEIVASKHGIVGAGLDA